MKNKFNNITAKKDNAEASIAAQQIQNMSWDEIFRQTGNPVACEEMMRRLYEAQKDAKSRHESA